MPDVASLCARLLPALLLAAGSAHAASGYAVNYYSLPGMATTDVFDIDNDGQLLAWGRTSLTDISRSFLVGASGPQELLSPTGQIALGRAFGPGGMIVGAAYDLSLTTPQGNPGTSGFVNDPVGGWRRIASPEAGDPTSLVSGVSPNGRYIAGLYTRSDAFPPLGHYVQDLSTGNRTLIPSSAGLFAIYTADDAGRVYGSSTTLPRRGLIYDAASGQSTVLPNLGFRSMLARAVNASGLMAGSLQQQDGTEFAGFIATPVVLPEPGGPSGTFQFSIDVRADTPVFIDPLVAVGYTYAIGEGNPLFKSVSLPVGIGDGRYTLAVGDQTLDIGGSQIVDFTALGFKDGVAGFTVTGIETSAQLDPADASAFVTRLTFMTDGRFTGTQTALTVDVSAVPEPGTVAQWLLGLAALAGIGAQRHRRRPSGPTR